MQTCHEFVVGLRVGAISFARLARAQGESGLQRFHDAPPNFILNLENVVELEIVPSELEAFKTAIKENGQAAVREEPGCQQFNIVFEKDNPARVLLFEVYDNTEAFAAHQATAHFKKYLATTKDMIKSRKRIEMTPLALNAKPR